MSEQLLDIRNLDVIYDLDDEVVHAVNGLSLSINKGETLGLVGETGAGKTTTALSIMGLLPDRIGKVLNGNIQFESSTITSLSEAEMRKIRGGQISMIFQDPMTSLNPVLTVGEQIAEVLELHKKIDDKSIDDRVDELLELVGICALRKNDFPHQFSGGMKQRVIIAMALACDPKLLIADEPTTALDVTIQAQVLDMMEDLKHKLSTSMLLITHDLGVVSQICDKVAIMYAGEIIEFGTIYDVFENERHHPYTKGLFESIPDISSNARRLNPIDGLMPDPTDLPSGCKFHPRCPQAMGVCQKRIPENVQKGTHSIKCHLFD
ncbi:ABC transporter ATP-binding protein [Acidaminobacter sp. JC074]|uniref:ABC transporter ATP-binding protein n=1 Tax=Acidaminobacter sp. JC074 TaxID=2530199 RepID=UPI001F114F07|nr:ABC transporter ATP-binding protein [Acidaminobacter sp. JC074]MCH4886319.1 ABC transporter ATP-binding protein [Acidaminobacter sp. JC074]